MSNPVYVSKTLITASSTGLGTVSSAGVNSINSSALDTQRRIIIWSTGATLASVTFTVTGTREGDGASQQQFITGPTSNTAVATTRDFLTVTSVTPSSVMTNRATIGTNNQGSTPWQSVNTDAMIICLSAALTFSSTANSMTASIEITNDNVFLPPTQSPGGISFPINQTPTTFIAATFSSVTASTYDGINPSFTPLNAWRLLLTSSSSTAGNVNCAALQAGIG